VTAESKPHRRWPFVPYSTIILHLLFKGDDFAQTGIEPALKV
jgi:hypothetical protein